VNEGGIFTKYILAICDPEIGYAYHLMEALGRLRDFPFEVQVFTCAKKLYACREPESIRLLLTAESAYEEQMDQLPIGQILILKEQEEMSDDSRHPVISKYSSVSAIARKAMECTDLPGSFGKVSQRPNPITFIGIYTPVGRCLQTTFAFVTGQLLARNHKVLYLNLETCSGLGSMLGRSFAAELTDLLYFLNGPEETFLSKLYQMVEPVNGMDVCPPAFVGTDITQLKAEEWMHFMEVLAKSRYDYVILDLSDGVQGLYEILRGCSYVYTIVREDGFAMAKIEQYEQVLAQTAYEDILSKTRKCRFPIFKKLPRDLYHMTTGELAEFVEQMLQKEQV